jgi:hypothetical protein
VVERLTTTPSYSMRKLLLAMELCLSLCVGCAHNMKDDSTPETRRDINAVLADHDNELMAIPGVVGVYVGVLSDQRTPCLKVMLARNDPALKNKLPRTLEGYPVVAEVTGEIKPMK